MEINLSLEFYDDAQRSLFEKYPNGETIIRLTENPISVRKDEILAYMMFTEQKEVDGFKTYEDLQNRIGSRLGDIEDYLTFSDGSLSAKFIGDEMYPDFTERIGVSLGICTINSIHSLHEADWKKILEERGRNANPTFDFKNTNIASTGYNFIQVENKGSIVENNTQKISSVPGHFNSINRKKKYVRTIEKEMNVPLHKNLYYGTISVLDNHKNSVPKVWLVDPPVFEIEMNPRKYKILSRLHFYLDEFKNIGVKESLINAFEKRINALEETSEIDKFANKQLDYEYPVPYHLYMDGFMFASINWNEAFGRVYFIEYKETLVPYVVAFPKRLMQLIIYQDFNAILNYKYKPDYDLSNVELLMRVRHIDWEKYNLAESFGKVFKRKNRFEAFYYGLVNYSESGRIFGFLNPKKVEPIRRIR